MKSIKLFVIYMDIRQMPGVATVIHEQLTNGWLLRTIDSILLIDELTDELHQKG